jgi:DNA-binding response OmpR family regulator
VRKQRLHKGGVVDSRIRVLLVDDEPLIRKMVKLYLEQNGIAVVDADSGEKAKEAFEREPEAFDVVFTDIVMPGMSGRELVAALRQHRPDIPVIFMSGYSDQISDEPGGIECMTKPLDLRRVVAAISTVGASSRSRRQSGESMVPPCSRKAGC